MLFGTPLFLFGFLPLAWAGFHLAGRLGSGRGALILLLCMSFIFYTSGNMRDLPLLAGSILVNFWCAARVRAGPWFGLTVAANLGVLGLFKYGNLIAGSLGLGRPGLTLPLGISFYTFQQIMYLSECRASGERGSFLAYANCIAFFAHLIAGPLVRPAEVMPQIAASARRPVAPEEMAEALTIILLGLAKKLVLADGFAPLADRGFAAAAHGAPITLLEAWVALLAFALQIYFDFSGYSDMAIGLARLFGVRFPLNFNSPYKALTIREFWRRWNITLSVFLRDFVYIPLGGNRHGEGRRRLNLMITMLLGGLWHGADWRFLLWGGLHGLYLILHEVWSRVVPPRARLPRPLAQALTLLAVLLAWVPFRAQDMAATTAMLRGLLGLNGLALPIQLIALWPPLGAIAHPVPLLAALGNARTLSLPEALAFLALGWVIVLALPHVHEASDRWRAGGILASGGFMVQALFFAGAAPPFLYFRF
ncbi:MAG TPA: MBOAT family O-acyltransferase [Acidisoma sp.]|uniref:MBOAT family O-acyltransferase n=1 Tax=Acidisoma sp. TaxID=1872115 RepID=UPI002B79A7CC|nr:MBOAT family O-acyltransferase [Acidisoma sp.]HTI03539.1 MBOAT family O-acyltransferase [Acidisoma sp.]